MSMENSTTPSGIEPATFRFVAQHLNQLCYCGYAPKFGTYLCTSDWPKAVCSNRLWEASPKFQHKTWTSMVIVRQRTVGLPIIKASRSHSDEPQSVRFLWMSDQPVTENSTWQHTTFIKKNDIHAVGGIQTHNPSKRVTADRALDRAITGNQRWTLWTEIYLNSGVNRQWL